MAKASVDKLNALHDLLATYYSELLRDATDGEMEISSGTLSSIVSFLKANDITADVVESSPLQDLNARFQELIKESKVGW